MRRACRRLLPLALALIPGGMTLGGMVAVPCAIAAPEPTKTADAARTMAEVEAKVRAVAEAARDKTVAIRIERNGKALGFGSGAVISADGLVLTCAHVTEPARGGKMVAVFADGKEATLALVASNSTNDYSLCRTDPALADLPHFDLAEKDPALGEWVIALGHPGGPYADKQPSVAVGKVTATGRRLPIVLQSKHYVDAIQTDAPIFGGNSGGPLVDLAGRLAGINGAILLVGDASFSTPVSRIAKDLPALKAGKRVKGEPIEDLMGAMRDLSEELDPKELTEAFANEGIGKMLRQILEFATKMGGGLPERKKGAPRRIDDVKAAWPTAGAARAVALEKDGTRVGYACTWGSRGGKARFVTCARIVGDGKGLSVGSAVLASDAATTAVRLVGRDGMLDVALLEEAREDGKPAGTSPNDEPAPPMASDATPGSWVLVEGPGASLVQAGVVAAVGREVGTDRRVPTIGIVNLFKPPNTSPFRPYPAMTQIDCPLASDQFGGPVVRPDGTVVGIAVAHLNRGCTFVAPFRPVRAAVAAIEAGRETPAPETYDPSKRKPGEEIPMPDLGGEEEEEGLRFEVATMSGVGRPVEFADAASGSVPAGPVATDSSGVRSYDVREGDVLASIGDVPVADLAAAEKAVAALADGAKVRVGLMRKDAPGRYRFEALDATLSVHGVARVLVIRSVAR